MMTGSTGATQFTGSSTAASKATGSTGQLDKDAFLMLLITQLRNQDPLKPMEDKEFIAQLAQFTSLEQMQSLNKTVEPFSKNFDMFAANQSATSMIGHTASAVDSNPATDSRGRLITPKLGDDGKPVLDGSGKEQPAELVGTVDSVKFSADGPRLVMKVSQKERDTTTGEFVTVERIREIPISNVLSVR